MRTVKGSSIHAPCHDQFPHCSGSPEPWFCETKVWTTPAVPMKKQKSVHIQFPPKPTGQFHRAESTDHGRVHDTHQGDGKLAQHHGVREKSDFFYPAGQKGTPWLLDMSIAHFLCLFVIGHFFPT